MDQCFLGSKYSVDILLIIIIRTTKLIKIYNWYKSIRRVKVIKSKLDDRYDDTRVITHPDVNRKSLSIKADPVKRLSDVKICEDEIDVILIDEGQFIPDINLTLKWVNMGIDVYIFALMNDYLKKPFENILSLAAVADKTVRLKGGCNTRNCTYPSMFTFRSKEYGSKVILVGGCDIYKSYCRKCYLTVSMGKLIDPSGIKSHLKSIGNDSKNKGSSK